MNRVVLVCAIAATLQACKRNEQPSASVSLGSAAISSIAAVEGLGQECAPDAKAHLVLIAAKDPSRDVRCAALRQLAARDLATLSFNSKTTENLIDALAQPPTMAALRQLLADTSSKCVVERGWYLGEDARTVSPAEAALWTLAIAPIPALRSDVEKVPAIVEARATALAGYDYWQRRRDSDAVRYVDSLTADSAPSGFVSLIEFAANGYQWPTNVSAPAADDMPRVRVRTLAALQALDRIAAQHPNEVRYSARCIHDVQTAIRTGRLGEVLLADFDRLDADLRYAIMNIFRDTARTGSKSALQRIANADPDKHVRDAAELALKFVDTGGYSTERPKYGSDATGMAPGIAGSGQ